MKNIQVTDGTENRTSLSVRRIVFATLLAMLAGALILLALLVPRPDAVHTAEKVTPWVWGAVLAVTSVYYFRSWAFWNGKLVCPHCGQRGWLQTARLGRPRLSIVAWVVGSCIGTVLYSHARKRRYCCASCGGSSHLRNVGGWLAIVWMGLLVYTLGVESYAFEETKPELLP